MRPAVLGAGGLAAGVLAVALFGLRQTEAEAPPVDRARLAAVAAEHLGDELDSAAVLDLRTGALLLAHHPEALARRRILPGSVMKVFTAYALEQHQRAEQRFVCEGEHTDRLGITRPCWRRDGHGPMQLRTAISESCNVWFYEQVAHVPDRALLEVYRRFGIGERWAPRPDLGLRPERDLVPAAVPDRDLPDVAVGDHVMFRVTPLSLLRAVSVIATRGRRLEPRGPGAACAPLACEQVDLDPRVLERIAEGMREATASGTLAEVFDASAEVVAKTGTAKKWQVRGMRGLVVGFLPADAPRYAFVVVKDHGQGAKDAGPPARAIVEVLVGAGS